MSILDFLKSIFSKSQPKPPTQTLPSNSGNSIKKLTYAEKELLAVRRTTLADVQQLKGFPFKWNYRLEKSIEPNGHPFAYMDIIGENLSIAISELEKMNAHMEHSKTLCKKIPKSLQIPTKDIVFKRSTTMGYTRLLCSPITYLGEPSEFPIVLAFMTNLERNDTTDGALYYGQNGSIQKANIYFWRRGIGYFFYFETVNDVLVLSKIESTSANVARGIIYKGEHILALEAKRAQEEKDFEWVQQNIPDKCPKSITSYRRMQTQNTKNFQALQALAAEKGRSL